MIKLIAFDLDGTILDDEKRLPEENLSALKEAAEKGVVIVPSTGRIFTGVPEVIRALPFVRYYITCNGASVYDAVEKTSIYRSEIEPELAVRVCRHMDTLDVIYDCYQDDWGWIDRAFYEKAADYIPNRGIYELLLRSRTPVDDLKATLTARGRGVQKMQMHFRDMEARRREIEDFPRLFPELLATSSIPTNIEINSPAAHKGSALLGLCRCLGLERSECAAFGDGTNDLTMLRDAGLGIAMANAEPEVKAAADRITLSNNDCGVAKAIRELL